jgi:transaldolase
MNPLHQLKAHGQSVWLDSIDPHFIRGGELKKQVEEDEISGATLQPDMLARASDAIDCTYPESAYDQEMHALRQGNASAPAIAAEKLAIADIRAAADILRPLYEQTHGGDGYVSLHVSPALADDTEKTVAEARRLWHEIDRQNLLVGIPATATGISAMRQLVAGGINVNATLLFSQAQYEQTAQAYLDGLEQLVAQGGNPAGIASVASFHISAVDSAVDAIITGHLNQCGWIKTYNAMERESLRNLLGKTAVANAKVAYARYQAIFSGPRWDAWAAQGARKQRLLWANTGIENLAYRDVKYIEELIGPDTVTTLPPATLAAFRDHGRVRNNLSENTANAAIVLSTLKTLRISLDDVAGKLLAAGIKQLSAAYEKEKSLNANQ